MLKNITKHLSHYLSLIGVLICALFSFWIFGYDRYFQIATAFAVTASYVSWGIIHHLMHNDLYWEVVFEYLLTGALGLVLLFSLIFRV